MPNFSLEDELAVELGVSNIAGIDEVGRGPWAGPVIACVVLIDRTKSAPREFELLDDSKKLSAKRREGLYDLLIEHVNYALGEASVEEIDEINILAASLLAMRRAASNLVQRGTVLEAALVDGNRDPKLGVPTRLVVKGDTHSLSIAAASVIAKVRRDRLMAALAEEFPYYGWERNAGYGVKAHQQGLAAHGVTMHHRRSFAPIRKLLHSTGDAERQKGG